MAAPDWQEFYASALAFREMAPWQWMADTAIFGVQDPDAPRIGWCVVLGAGGDMEGLVVYLGDEGFDFYRNTQLMGAGQMDPEEFYGQDALVFFFGARDEVSKEQRDVIKAVGLRPRGRTAWPCFQEHRTGFMPRYLAAADAAFMKECLLQTLFVAVQTQDDPTFVQPDQEGRLLVLRPGPNGDWSEDRVPVPGPVEHRFPQVDQVELGRLRARFPRSNLVLELDVFPLHGAAIDSEEGPFIPASPLVVDAGSGMILGQDLCHPRDRHVALQAALLKAIEQVEALPQAVLVARTSVHDALAPICTGLDVGIELVEELPTLQPARESLARFMMGGGL